MNSAESVRNVPPFRGRFDLDRYFRQRMRIWSRQNEVIVAESVVTWQNTHGYKPRAEVVIVQP